MVTVWWFAARLIHYSFLNPSETIISEKYAQQIDELHIKTETSTASPGQQKRAQFSATHPTACSTTNASEIEQTGLFICHIHLPSCQTDYHCKYLNNFLQGQCCHNQQEAENAFQEFIESQSMDFLPYRNKLIYLLLAETLIVVVPILFTKMCLSLVIII